MKVVIYRTTEDTCPKDFKYIIFIEGSGMWDTRFFTSRKIPNKKLTPKYYSKLGNLVWSRRGIPYHHNLPFYTYRGHPFSPFMSYEV